jgi:hypothetical protein
MRPLLILMIMGAFFLNAGCAHQQPNQLPLAPRIGFMGLNQPIPLDVGLLISEESRDRIFTSAPDPDRRFGNPIYYTLEPYQFSIGQAFENAALHIFSLVFHKVTLLRTIEEARNCPVVLEPRIEDFYFHLAYYVYSLFYPRHELVDGQCKVQVAGTLISRGSPVWQKRVETPLKTERWVGDDWLRKSVGELASDTMVLALKDLAYRLVEDSQRSVQAPRGWLEEIDRVRP